ncbi:MAG: ATP-binding protein [Desulfosarcina sp.]
MEFEDAQIVGQWSSKKPAKVIGRIRRNVLSAMNLLTNATMFLSLDQVSINPTEVVLSSVISRAVIEVSDLKSLAISENLQLDSTLGRFKSVCRQGGLMLHVDASLWDRRVRIDQDRVNQVIVNLLLNAFKYRKKIIDVTARYRDRHLHLSVKDDGKGIDRFGMAVEKETKTDHQGPQALTIESHGIGLFLVHTILSELGGQLTIESPPGQGAAFNAVIPC